MKRLFVILAMVCVLCLLCGCGQGGAAAAAGSVNTDPVFHETRSADAAVLIADVNRVWDGGFPMDTEENWGCAVLECTVRRVIEEQESGGKPVEEQLAPGDSFFLWIGLDVFVQTDMKWKFREDVQLEEALDILGAMESVAIWGKQEAQSFREDHPSYAAIREAYGEANADGTVSVQPSVLICNPMRSWELIPLNGGAVDAKPMKELSKAVYGNDESFFQLDAPWPETGLYFANGDTEEEFVAAAEKFAAEQDAGKEWLNRQALTNISWQKQMQPYVWGEFLFTSVAFLLGFAVLFLLWKILGRRLK